MTYSFRMLIKSCDGTYPQLRKKYLQPVLVICSKQILCHLDKTKSRHTHGPFSAYGRARSQPRREAADLYFFIDRDFSSRWKTNPGRWFNIKMPSYQYRKSHCAYKTIIRSSYLYNGNSSTGKVASLYWSNPQVASYSLLFYHPWFNRNIICRGTLEYLNSHGTTFCKFV